MRASRSSWLGVGFGFTAAICYAGLNVAIRFANAHMSIWHIVFYRSLFGLVAVALLARLSGGGILGRRRWNLCLAGIAGAVGIAALTEALVVLPLFEALVLLYLFPAFSALLSPWLTTDRMTRRDWSLIGTACCGAALVLWSGRLGSSLQWGHFLGLAAAFCLGLTFTLIRRVSADNSALTPFFFICAAGLVVTVGPMLYQVGTPAISAAGLPALSAVAMLACAAHLAGNKALVYLPSPQVGVICMSEVVFGAIIGMLLFEEFFGWRTLLGGVLIVGAGIGLNVRRSERQEVHGS
jgi:drug/metabolite transporter (DMT)-like permease